METVFSFSAILDEARRGYSAAGRSDQCPDIGILLNLDGGDVDKAPERFAADHIDHCSGCGLAMLKIEADAHQWELEMAASPENALSSALGAEGRRMVRRLMAGASSASTMASAIKDTAVAWVSKLWTPTWAGETVTALDLPEQSRHFDMGDGEYVNLNCSWEGGQTRQTRRIRLAWSANIFSPGKIWVHFVDPESGTVLGKYCLGDDLEGAYQLDPSDLAFDPSTRKWAIQIVIKP